MITRLAFGDLPPKHHVTLRGPGGALRYEECLTREGFAGPYSILYHLGRPHAVSLGPPALRLVAVETRPKPAPLQRRHYRTGDLHARGSPAEARLPLLHGADLIVAVAKPDRSDHVYRINADADEVVFVRRGRGVLRSVFGDLAFSPGDYLIVPKGVLHRYEVESVDQEWLVIGCGGRVGIPEVWRNDVGQLRMDAPYGHRDFRPPVFRGPLDEGIRDVVVQRGGAYHGMVCPASPLDVVGWDGAVYPVAFPILSFQPRVGAVHLPPTVHGTFAARGALICSFVPRPLDFHPDAIPCPYPHASVDVDEVLYYVSGDFTSRTGIGEGSLTFHPAGLPHGPHPGRYEGSLGHTTTTEVAVMIDAHAPLAPTPQADNVEDATYDASFAT